MKRKCLSFAAVLLTLGGLASGGQVSAQSITGEQIRLFGSFYHGSLDTFFELVGDDLLNMPTEELQALPAVIQRNACLVIVDHTTYRSVMAKGLEAAHGEERMIEFLERAKDSRKFLFKDLEAKFETISEKSEYCLRSGVVWIDTTRFTDDYADTPTEFQLRALYESQVPFIQWVWRTIPPSEERRYMEALIPSMERKYLLDITDP